jgi:isopentenyl-diphosphate Delta-isomerase
MDELWQLYNEQGMPIAGKGAPKDEVFGSGLLHGASHVWIWRIANGKPEVLVQKRAHVKRTWPGCYDISAAGHIDVGESPLDAVLREAQEEISLIIDPNQLKFFGVYRADMVAENGDIENEFQWLFLLELPGHTDFDLQEAELASLDWLPLDAFIANCTGTDYVPHGKLYYETVIQAIKAKLE